MLRDDTVTIEKKGCIIYTEPDEQVEEENTIHQEKTHGVIGILNLGTHIFIILITERSEVAKMPSGDWVYLITAVKFVPFDKNIYDYQQLDLETVKYVEGLKNVLETQGFYFSYNADLTSNR